jgi:tRNA (guanine10-N2)-methyltransferase
VRDGEESGDMYVPAHKDFREKYFQGFKKDSER